VLQVKTLDREGGNFGGEEAFGCAPGLGTLLSVVPGCSWEEAEGDGSRQAALVAGSEPSLASQS